MTRLIDAEALIEILAEMQGRCATKAALVHNSKIWQQVKDMPTVDAVPVVRCKDCKYYSCGTVEGKHLCMSVKYRFTPTTENEWCSRAERKEE